MQDKFKITFLAAANGTALTKKYTSGDGSKFETEPYPLVKDLNSFEYEVDSLQDWLTYIIAHSDENHCYLKGKVEDWDGFYQYIQENEAFHLLQRRVSTAAARETLEAGENISGVSTFTKRAISLRKIT